MQRYLIAGGVITTSILPFVCNVLKLSFNSHFLFPLMGGYLIYPLLGYYLHTGNLKSWQ